MKKYYCDICGKYIEKIGDVFKVFVFKNYMEVMRIDEYDLKYNSCDCKHLCRECFNRIRNSVIKDK